MIRAGSERRPIVDLLQDFLREGGLSEGTSLGTDAITDSSATTFSVIVAPSVMTFSAIVASSAVSGMAGGVGDWVRRDLCGTPGVGDKGGALLTMLSIIIALGV